MKLFVIISIALLMCTSPLNAHGDLDQRIEAISTMIESYPDSAALYFIRGKLRFQHEEYQAAIEDIDQSIINGHTSEFQNIYLAKSFFKLNKFSESLDKLNLFLHDDPNNVVALKLKASIFFAQNNYEESAHFYEKVIQLSIKSLPENYLEAAKAWSASTNPNKYGHAVRILELGLKNLGPIITLQNELIKVHLYNNNSDQAIQTQLIIIEKTKRKESAYFRLAEIYLQIGETKNAAKAAEMALYHFEQLPGRIQKNTAMKTLKIKIQQLTNKL